MATLEELQNALRNADAAGDVGAARQLANEIKRRQADTFTPEPPPGMVLDPNTGQMVDTRAIAEQQSQGIMGQLGNVGAVAAQGVPFVGEYFDEAAGMGDPVRTQVARERQKLFDEQTPTGVGTATRIAGGLAATAPAAIAAAPAVAGRAATSLLGRMLQGGSIGGATGAAEGAVSGYGAGEGDDRMESAWQRSIIGGLLGAGVGAASPAVAQGASAAARNVLNRPSRQVVAQQGLQPESAEILLRSMEADDALGGTGARNIAAAGSGAMVADAGPSTRGLLDVAMQQGGRAARVASEAVEDRASAANRQITSALDDVLGAPQGVRTTAREIAQRTAPAREAAYRAAYETPIDYAAASGRNIENVLGRIPDRIKRQAIETANEAMQAAGTRNQQMFINIADDGTVTLRTPPNVQQLDELKKALGEIGAESIDQFGRRTAAGNRASGLARELRDAISEAVPGYRDAVNLGGDKIAEDNALALGSRLFRQNTTREIVKEAADGMTKAEHLAAAQGIRSTIDETLANVRRVASDPNIDARQAAKAVTDLSSPANREKVALLIGDEPAQRLFAELDEAAKAFDLRTSVAINSKTQPRQVAAQVISDRLEGGPVAAMAEGRPVNATQRGIQALTGRTPAWRQAQQDQIYAEIANILTGPRGPDAMIALQNLQRIAASDPRNRALAEALGSRAGAVSALGAYQTGSQLGANR